jgi:predicted nuclease of predicted toxin-antitoxin system
VVAWNASGMMKLLLDENLPHDLRHFLTGHEVFTVAYMGWKKIENGDLLVAAGKAGFDVMLTLDSGVEYEQHLAALPVAVLIIKCKSSRIDDLRPLVPDVLSALSLLRPKTLAHVGY